MEQAAHSPGTCGPDDAFRRPYLPAPLERYDITHPAVPPALDGMTILHLTDLHVTRPPLGRPGFRRLLDGIAGITVDLVALTGDYTSHPGDEPHALAALALLRDAWRARIGAFGVFGNHDSALVVALARRMPGITWLHNSFADVPGLPLRVIGCGYPEDLLGTLLSMPGGRAGVAESPERFPLTLVHHPTEILPAAEFGLPLLLAGHTHGGQVRVSARLAPHTSSDMPMTRACGVLRLRSTLACVSRGLGEALVELRVNCPPQAPVYTLRRGPLPARRADRLDRPSDAYASITRVRAW